MKLALKIFIISVAAVSVLSGILFISPPALGATYTVTVSQNWSAFGTTPTSADTVTVLGGATLTVDVSNAICGTLRLEPTGSGTATLSFSSATSSVSIGTTLVVGGSASNRRGSINMTNGGFLRIGGTISIVQTGGTWTRGTGTVDYYGGAQSLPTTWITAYTNLTFSGSGAKTITTGAKTVNGILSMEGTATVTMTGSLVYGASATLQYKGSAAQITGAEFPSTWTTGTGGVKIENANGVTLNAIRNMGAFTFTIGSSIANSVFNDGGYQLTATGTLNLTSGTMNLGSATVATTWPAFGTRNIAVGTTVGYIATPNQTVSSTPNYQNLTLGGAGIKTTTGVTANGILSMEGTATVSAAPTYGATATLQYKGSSAQTTGLEFKTSLYRLTINNANGVVMSNSSNITNTLTLTSGKITTGSNTLIIASGGTVSGGSSSSFVFGNLKKNYAAGSSVSRTFEVGVANYNPVTLVFNSVSSAGDLTVNAISGQHSNIGSSHINSAKDVNVYWTLTNSGIVFDSYNAVFNFVAGDILGGANTANFIVGKYDAGWSYPTVGTKTSTSTQITGVTAFSDFVLGESTTHTVTYDGNGSTGGSVPVDGSSPYYYNATVTVLGNTGSLVKTGYTFNNWNTAANGSGTPYSSGNTFNITANTTLYAQWTINTYTVTYDGNGSTGGSAPTDGSSPYNYNTTVTVLGNTGSLVRTGYTFNNWNTAANGSGTAYIPTNTFAMPASNIILYAQWTINTYTVTYDGNGSTSGSVPVDSSSPYNYNATVTVLGNTGSLVKTGYTFNNWNTAANGSGTAYIPTNTFSIAANTVLYAQWTINSYTVIYDGNGSTGGSAPTDGSSPYNYNTTVTVLGNTGSLVRTGYTFNNWNTAANGSGTPYSSGNTFNITANTTLYAQWTINSYTVTYDGNGSTGGSAPTDGSSPYNYNTTVTVLGNTGSLVRTGYTFNNWNTAANGSGTAYIPTNTFAMPASNIILYAQWTINTYTVTYDGNGSTSGSVPVDSSSPYNYNATVTVLGNTGSLVKTGYTFNNWNTAANGSGTAYIPTNTFSIAANTVLYAQWTINTYTVTYDGNGSTGGSAPTDGSSPYNYNTTVTVLGNTGSLVRTGYTFNNWNTAANGSGTAYIPANTFAMPAGNVVLYAQWTTIGPHTITASGNAGGSISPSGAVSVPDTGNQTFTITVNLNHTLTDVLVDSVSVGAVTSYTFTNVTTDHTIQAVFDAITYNIVASAGAGGSIFPSGTVIVNQSDNQTFSISANPGYNISDVLVDSVSVGAVSSYTFTNVTAAHTISASFTVQTFTLSIDGDTGGLITPTGAVVKNYSDNQTISFSADPGYYITNVMVDGVSQGIISSYTFTNITANHTLYVTFYTTAVANQTGDVTITGAQTGAVVDGSTQASTVITVNTNNTVDINIINYNGNPHPEAAVPGSVVPIYNDVVVSNLGAVNWPMHVEISYTDLEIAGIDESTLKMYYYRGNSWHLCSSTGVNAAGNFVWADLTQYEASGSPLIISGGPLSGPVAVGGEVYRIDKFQVLLPWLALPVGLLLFLVGGTAYIISKRRRDD